MIVAGIIHRYVTLGVTYELKGSFAFEIKALSRDPLKIKCIRHEYDETTERRLHGAFAT